MRLAKMTAPGKVEMLKVPVPHIGKDQVLMKVSRIGLCGSDMQMYHGKHKYIHFPIIPGHEAAGVIEAVGAGVTDYKPGDKVVMQPQVTCGQCTPCMQGRFNVCESQKSMGAHLPGAACDYMAVGAKFLHHIPQDMPMDEAVLAEPFAVGVGAAKRSGRVRGGTAVIVGSGTIGNCVAQAVKAAGAACVLVLGSNPEHLAYAKECGADICMNTREISVGDAIGRAFGGRRADVIFDCAGVPALFDEYLKAARPMSDIVLTANYKEPVTMEVPVIQRQEISLIGHMMYVREDFQDAIRGIYDGTFHVSGFVSRKMPFAEYPDVFVYADEHKKEIMKIIISMEDELEEEKPEVSR